MREIGIKEREFSLLQHSKLLASMAKIIRDYAYCGFRKKYDINKYSKEKKQFEDAYNILDQLMNDTGLDTGETILDYYQDLYYTYFTKDGVLKLNYTDGGYESNLPKFYSTFNVVIRYVLAELDTYSNIAMHNAKRELLDAVITSATALKGYYCYGLVNFLDSNVPDNRYVDSAFTYPYLVEGGEPELQGLLSVMYSFGDLKVDSRYINNTIINTIFSDTSVKVISNALERITVSPEIKQQQVNRSRNNDDYYNTIVKCWKSVSSVKNDIGKIKKNLMSDAGYAFFDVESSVMAACSKVSNLKLESPSPKIETMFVKTQEQLEKERLEREKKEKEEQERQRLAKIRRREEEDRIDNMPITEKGLKGLRLRIKQRNLKIKHMQERAEEDRLIQETDARLARSKAKFERKIIKRKNKESRDEYLKHLGTKQKILFWIKYPFFVFGVWLKSVWLKLLGIFKKPKNAEDNQTSKTKSDNTANNVSDTSSKVTKEKTEHGTNLSHSFTGITWDFLLYIIVPIVACIIFVILKNVGALDAIFNFFGKLAKNVISYHKLFSWEDALKHFVIDSDWSTIVMVIVMIPYIIARVALFFIELIWFVVKAIVMWILSLLFWILAVTIPYVLPVAIWIGTMALVIRRTKYESNRTPTMIIFTVLTIIICVASMIIFFI